HRALRHARVPTEGAPPPLRGAAALFADGRVDALPVHFGGVLRAAWFGARDAAELVSALRSVQRRLTAPRASQLSTLPAAAWLDDLATRAPVRALLATLLRLATYGGDVQQLSADVAQLQLAASLRHGVRYVHGGWQTLVDGLLAQLTRRGGQLAHARAHALELGDSAGVARRPWHRVIDAEGRRYLARDLVLACSPGVAATLLAGADPGLAAFAARARPVVMRCVDLGVRGSEGLRFTLGVDVPFYLSPQRDVQGVAPDGHTTVHAGYYLGADGSSPLPGSGGEQLDAAIAAASPGLEERVVERRVLPRAVVHNALPTWSTGGLRGRPACASSVPGVWFAGDWVGPTGYLADAAAASALDVASGIARDGEGGLRCAS
ncbi:MAG: hypothetical protein KC593_14735, partial [Myxococcales bacterium]|nr:hypothetical protein [Myxococcales bacterium]